MYIDAYRYYVCIRSGYIPVLSACFVIGRDAARFHLIPACVYCYWLDVVIFVGDAVFYSLFWLLGVHSYAVLLPNGD